MTSYLVIIETDSHQTSFKMCLRDVRTATENCSCRQKNHLGKILEKSPLNPPPPPPPHNVPLRVKIE